MSRQAALALDAFQHPGFLAADIGARAAAQVQLDIAVQARVLDLCDLGQQNLAAGGVFVAQVDVDGFGLDRPGGEQGAFDHPVGIGLQAVAVLEGARLAFVAVDGDQTRLRRVLQKAPLGGGRETGAAQAAQFGGLDLFDQLFTVAGAVQTFAKDLVTALVLIGGKVFILRQGLRHVVAVDGGFDRVGVGVENLLLFDDRHGGLVAGPNAGRGNDAYVGPKDAFQLFKKRSGALHRTGDAVADPYGHGRGRVLAFLHHVEVMIEGRDLIDLGLRHAQFSSQCGQIVG